MNSAEEEMEAEDDEYFGAEDMDLPWQRKLQIQSECSRNRPACIDVCVWDV